ncbi:DUF1573 domain-containing protein [Algivirga pacifica]|uniref:DUF1573 domain-containing protein n=1 Tax=Algivirga pacifica TaxID=1162670 RepID=UPI0031EEDACB
MKKVLLLVALPLLLIVNAFGQEAKVDGPKITFEETKHEFGDITQGDVVTHVFKFKNEGTAPLQLNNVRTTCGCTAPQWPKEAIMPGETSEIKVVFNSRGKRGLQNKVITIYSNAVNNTETVKIVTNVLMPKQETE